MQYHEFPLTLAALARYLSNAFVDVEVELTAHIETDPVAVARLVVDVHEGDLDGVGALRVERHPVRTAVFGVSEEFVDAFPSGRILRTEGSGPWSEHSDSPVPPNGSPGNWWRRIRLSLFSNQNDRHAPNNVDQLAFKYMEMCKVESSTDSDSEISPRWSDTSTMQGCVSSAPENGTFRQTLPLTRKPAGRHSCQSLFLDPYDGSSEDSDESNVDVGVSSRRARQQGKGGGGCRFSGRSRRYTIHHPASFREVLKNGMRDSVTEQQPLLGVQMKCGSDSDLWVCDLDILPSHNDRGDCRDLKEEMSNDSTTHTQTMDIDIDCQHDDSGVHEARSSTPQAPGCVTPVEGSRYRMLDSSSERSPSPCNPRSLYKRKLGFPGAEAVELGQRKKQCIVNMEDEHEREAGGSASEPC